MQAKSNNLQKTNNQRKQAERRLDYFGYRFAKLVANAQVGER